MAAIPAAFKTVLSAIKRAEECEKSPDRNNQVLAYACRLYALNKAMKLSTRSSEESTFLVQQMDLLEAAKKQFNIAEAEAKTAVETQATLLFNKADEIDRAGYADKGTAKLFYAAATYFDVFEHFGDLAVEVLEMRKYCKWKAAEIINACNSGVKPTPGGYGEVSTSIYLHIFVYSIALLIILFC